MPMYTVSPDSWVALTATCRGHLSELVPGNVGDETLRPARRRGERGRDLRSAERYDQAFGGTEKATLRSRPRVQRLTRPGPAIWVTRVVLLTSADRTGTAARVLGLVTTHRRWRGVSAKRARPHLPKKPGLLALSFASGVLAYWALGASLACGERVVRTSARLAF